MKYLYYILRLFFSPKPPVCEHKFETLSTEKYVEKYHNLCDEIRFTTQLRCEKCGDIKFINHSM